MAKGIVARLFGASSKLPRDVDDALAELARLPQERPELAGPCALLADVLPGLYEVPVSEAPPAFEREYAAAKLAGGVPLLRGENLAVDTRAFGQRWQHICAALARHQQDSAPKMLAAALRDGQLDAGAMVRELLAGRVGPEPRFLQETGALGLDAGMTASVLRLTLYPVLTSLNARLAALHDGISWEHGYCPTCGGGSFMGEFRGLEQRRFLRCSLCAAAWEFPRLRCPFCGNRDHDALGYFHVEGEETKYRAATCAACRGYVKMASTLFAPTAPRLLVLELATTHLDLTAAERGFGTG